MNVKLDHESPIFGVKIPKKYLKLPPIYQLLQHQAKFDRLSKTSKVVKFGKAYEVFFVDAFQASPKKNNTNSSPVSPKKMTTKSPLEQKKHPLRTKTQPCLKLQGQLSINGSFNWMIPNLYMENGWKSPNIHKKLAVWSSRWK